MSKYRPSCGSGNFWGNLWGRGLDQTLRGCCVEKNRKTLKTIRDKRIQVEGHTDSRPLRWDYREKFPTNWELSAARAAIIVRYLIDNVGIDATRLSAVGYGLYQPVASNDSPEGQQANRRVEFALLPIRSAVLENME